MSATLLSMMFDDREVRHPPHMECDAFYVVAEMRCAVCGRAQSVKVSSKPVEVSCCEGGLMKPWMTPERLAERWYSTHSRLIHEDPDGLPVATAREVLEWLDTGRRIWSERYIEEALAREREREDANE
jgi:hypothetical protein